MVDCELGFPRGYGKLCSRAHKREGRFQEEDGDEEEEEAEMSKLSAFDSLFPHDDNKERDPPNARQHAGILWQELDHLGNAGFDPVKFRVDLYGNVVYWHADPGSPLAWEVDHWFPYSRGGKTVVSNLRILQWQAREGKGTKLEFLVPRCDLQIGISVSQFLSVFSSKNADFRQRAFSLFFQAGENEDIVKGHSWPQDFHEKKNQVGLAAAAIVKVRKTLDDTLRVLNHNKATKQASQIVNIGNTPARRRWTLDEEEALRKAVQIFGPGNWKEIKESEPMLVNRSTVQIKDKYRQMKGEWKLDKENKEGATDSLLSVTMAIQKEETIKHTKEKEKKKTEEQIALLVDQLKHLNIENEKERCLLEELEKTLANEKKRIEKERKWSETQAEYKLCLDRMIRDTMHECDAYKEEARLNQAACNELRARLESWKATRDGAEMEFVKGVKERESLECIVRPEIIKNTVNETQIGMEICMTPIANKEINHKSNKMFKWHGILHNETLKETVTLEEPLRSISDSSEGKGSPVSSEEEYNSSEEFLHDQEVHVSTSLLRGVDVAIIQALDDNGRDQNESAVEMLNEFHSSMDSTRSREMKQIVLEGNALEDGGTVNNKQVDDSKWDQEVQEMKGKVWANTVDNVEDVEDEKDERSAKELQEPTTEISINVETIVYKEDRHCPKELEVESITETRGNMETLVADSDHVAEKKVSEAEDITTSSGMLGGFLKKLKLKQGKEVKGKVYTVDVIGDDKDDENETTLNMGISVPNKAHHCHVAESNVSGDEKIIASTSMLDGILKRLNLKHGKAEEEEDHNLFTVKKGNVGKPDDRSHEKHNLSPWRRKPSLSLKRFASVNGATGLTLLQKSKGSSDINDISLISSFSGAKVNNDDHKQEAVKEDTTKTFSEMEVVQPMRGGRDLRELSLKLPQKSEEILPTLRDILEDSSSSSASASASSSASSASASASSASSSSSPSSYCPRDCKGSPSSKSSLTQRPRARHLLHDDESSCSSSQSPVHFNGSLLLKESSFSQGPLDCNLSSPSSLASSSSSSLASRPPSLTPESASASASASALASPPPSLTPEAHLESGRASAPASASASKTLETQVESSGGQGKPQQQEKQQHMWMSLLKSRISNTPHLIAAEALQKQEDEASMMQCQSQQALEEDPVNLKHGILTNGEEKEIRTREGGGGTASKGIMKDGTGDAVKEAMAPLKKHWDATLSHVWRKAVKKFDLGTRQHP